jgi:hypothetical protein
MFYYLNTEEEGGDEEVTEPIDEGCDRHGCRSGSLREQLGRDHPGDGARPHREEYNEGQREDDSQVRNPVQHVLEHLEKLLRQTRVSFQEFKRFHKNKPEISCNLQLKQNDLQRNDTDFYMRLSFLLAFKTLNFLVRETP